jgi:uncharacterized membrane protein YhhN
VNRDSVLTVVFFILLAVHLVAGEWGWTLLTFLTKPALLTSLLIYFVVNLAKFGSTAFGYLIAPGLVFSLGGDVLLMFQDDGSYFLFGLGSFLLAHLFYIAAFTKTYLVNHEIKLLKKYGWVMILVVGYAWFFFNAIKDHLDTMLGPVLVYTMVISLMLLIALNRYKKVSSSSFTFIAFGAALFVASDSLLAWNKFVRDLDHAHFWIMSTYALAQFGITRGAVVQVRDQSVKSMYT